MERTYAQIEELVRGALKARFGAAGSSTVGDVYVWVRDIADSWVVFCVEGVPGSDGMWRSSYVIDEAGTVTLGDPEKVQAQIEYETVEATSTEPGRVLEAKADNPAGGRVFHVRIIAAGDSKNGRRYPLPVLREAAPLYEGAKAFDHHRTDVELMTSTVEGLVGQYRNVQADPVGIVADLHLLPSATHIAEGLDASLAAQADGLPPIMGISHDVQAQWRIATVTEGTGSRRLEEATKIVRVLSADVVADPAAGGVPLRMVAGGVAPGADSITPTVPEEEHIMSLAEILASATDEDKQALRDLLGAPAATTTTTESATDGEPATDDDKQTDGELVGAGAARESITTKLIVKHAVESAGLDPKHVDTVMRDLPERVTESDITQAVARIQRIAESFELSGLKPRTTEGIRVGTEVGDKTRERVYHTVCGNYREGFTSYFDMFEAVSGERVRPGDPDDAARIIREAWAPIGQNLSRAKESVDTTSFAEVLGDSIARRLIAQYNAPAYSSWRKIVTVATVRDFRPTRRVRMGGYGDLPTVLQGAPYQPLTTPGDEEATYTVSKRGGTEDLTMESILNDDLGALARIPNELGRSAARTLYKFVWLTLWSNNPICSYDATALFAAGHGNTTAVALSNSGMNTLRQLMRDQPGFGVPGEPLGIAPKYLIVPNELEDLGNQLTSGQRAVPATTPGATDVPNLHVGTELIVIDHFTDPNDWYMAADPTEVPIIELGFLNGREEPELFMQDDPKVGAVFSSDKVSWKIRHIYSGTNLDHRGVQRATQ